MIFDRAYRLGVDADAAEEIQHWFERATTREIVRIAAAARVSFGCSLWQADLPLDKRIDPMKLAQLATSSTLVGVAALASLHRSGWVREASLPHLVATLDERVIPFLLLRTDDIVSSVRQAAEDAVRARLAPAAAPAFARALPIISLLVDRTRGKASGLDEAVHALLCDAACRDALVAASTSDPAPETRLAALRLRLADEPARDVIASALADRDVNVQVWASRIAISRTLPEADRRALLPALTASPSPYTRLLGLRLASRLDRCDDAPFERALLDANCVVRYAARIGLRTRHPERPFGGTRELALAVLATEGAPRDTVIGALGALSDVGLPTDERVVRSFLSDPRRSVRREAERTLSFVTASRSAPPS